MSSRYDTLAAKDEIFGFLVAGHETTSTTIAWGVKLLSDNQQAQAKLREVLRSTYVDAARDRRQPTSKELATLHHPYIDAMLEEILRCSTTAAITSRLAMVDTEVLGIRIPKGTDVNFLAYAGFIAPPVGVVEEHKRSPSSQASKDKTGVWEVSDIGVFKPERWLKPTGKEDEVEFSKNAGPTLPFGAGIRGCFGMLRCFLFNQINISNPPHRT
jgi:cytochrome P450